VSCGALRSGINNVEEAMKNLALKVQRFLVSEDGPTAVEYAVMLALIIVVCLTAIQAVGTNAASTFDTVSTKIGGTTSS
jgi:pilus assembly protein Flp/PilA